MQITAGEGSKFEVASLQKNISIIDYLYSFTSIPRIEIIRAQAK